MAIPLRALIVEDSEDDALLLLLELRRGGYEPRHARVETAEALEAALDSRPWDIVFGDFSMPRFNALGAIEMVKKRHLDLPFILISGSVTEDLAAAAMRSGASDFITKGNTARLLPAVERELREAAGRRQRRQAEAALRASEHRYRELFENANDVIFSVDLNGNFTDVNQAALSLFGYSREEALRMNFIQVVSPEQVEIARRLLGERSIGAPRTIHELDCLTKEGRLARFEISSRPLVEEGNVVGLQGIARDVTARRKLEAELLQAQKMEAVGRLAGGVAHDFNNLLTAITGFSDLLAMSLDPADVRRRNVDEIKKAADRAANLTRQLLAFSRKQIMQPRVLNLNDVVREIDKMVRRLIGEDVDVRADLDPVLGSIKADPGQIEQVIMNLVVNSRDAMPRGGRLLLQTSNIKLEEASENRPKITPPGNYVLFIVADSGVGMDKDIQAHMFEPFFTTKEPGKGTGLGLATVFGIVKQNGGYISVESTVGKGTAFRLYFPRVDEQPEKNVAPSELNRSSLDGNESVLLVEDDDAIRELVESVLRMRGYTVLSADRPERAVELFNQNKNTIALMLSDVIMPRTSGVELAQQLQDLKPDLKVLLISGYTDDALAHHGVLEKDLPLLPKPFTPDALAGKVREILNGPARSASIRHSTGT